MHLFTVTLPNTGSILLLRSLLRENQYKWVFQPINRAKILSRNVRQSGSDSSIPMHASSLFSARWLTIHCLLYFLIPHWLILKSDNNPTNV